MPRRGQLRGLRPASQALLGWRHSSPSTWRAASAVHKPSLLVADMLARHFGAMAAAGRAVTATHFSTSIGMHSMVGCCWDAFAICMVCLWGCPPWRLTAMPT